MTNSALLSGIEFKIGKCRKCPLYKTANHAVPGEGDPKAKIMFIGEAPGRNEDETGRPFVGRAGKLLDELLESINIKRQSVFITSIIKHRPPKNRPPKYAEIKECTHWLDLQINTIKPELIVTLGRFAMEYFLPEEQISLIHGKIVEKGYLHLFPVYHPAAGLRSTKNKRRLFEDFKKLKRYLKDI